MIAHLPCRKLRFVSSVLATLLLPGMASAQEEPTHMSESLRTSVSNVVVVGGASPIDQEITGSYEKATPGLAGGIGRWSGCRNPVCTGWPGERQLPLSDPDLTWRDCRRHFWKGKA